MAKRPRPWGDEPLRQSKMHISEREINENNGQYMNIIYSRTNDLLFEGAQRAAVQLPPSTEPIANSSCEMETDNSPNRRALMEEARSMDYMDFYPMRDTLMRGLIRRSHGSPNEVEKKKLYNQAKCYRQLNIDSFFKNQEPVNETDNNAKEVEQENGSMEMDE